MAPSPVSRCSVRPSVVVPGVWIFDFDAAAPGGKGGATVLPDQGQGLASITFVRKNRFLRRQSGQLLAEGLHKIGMPRPSILEAHNVREPSTRAALAAGGRGQGTLLGNTLADTAAALGATIDRWESVWDGSTYHIRAHVSYP